MSADILYTPLDDNKTGITLYYCRGVWKVILFTGHFSMISTIVHSYPPTLCKLGTFIELLPFVKVKYEHYINPKIILIQRNTEHRYWLPVGYWDKVQVKEIK